MIKDIKEVIAAAKAAGATIVNDARVRNVSIYVAAEGKNVDYWATLTVNKAIPAMLPDPNNPNGPKKKGLSTTVTMPIGTLVTILFDALLDVTDTKTMVKVNGREEALIDVCQDLCDYKAAIVADAEYEAMRGEDKPYTGFLHKLCNLTTINIICRDVKKGEKVKKLFSLNNKESMPEFDTVYHDIYGMSSPRATKVAEALEYAISYNAKASIDDAADAKKEAFEAIIEMYKKNSAANAVNAAL